MLEDLQSIRTQSRVSAFLHGLDENNVPISSVADLYVAYERVCSFVYKSMDKYQAINFIDAELNPKFKELAKLIVES